MSQHQSTSTKELLHFQRDEEENKKMGVEQTNKNNKKADKTHMYSRPPTIRQCQSRYQEKRRCTYGRREWKWEWWGPRSRNARICTPTMLGWDQITMRMPRCEVGGDGIVCEEGERGWRDEVNAEAELVSSYLILQIWRRSDQREEEEQDPN